MSKFLSLTLIYKNLTLSFEEQIFFESSTTYFSGGKTDRLVKSKEGSQED